MTRIILALLLLATAAHAHGYACGSGHAGDHSQNFFFAGGATHHPPMVGPSDYIHEGVAIRADSVEWKWGKLWFKWTVLNLRNEPIRIDRNQFRLIWVDGSERPRDLGILKLHLHDLLTLAPGERGTVTAEFKDDLSLGGAVVALHGVYAGDRALTLPLFETHLARWGEDRPRGPVDLAFERYRATARAPSAPR